MPTEVSNHRSTARRLPWAFNVRTWLAAILMRRAQGLAQLDGYLAGLGLESGWLVIFDRRPGLVPVAERLASRVERSPGGRVVTVIRA